MSDPTRVVHCSKLGQQSPGLTRPPFTGPIGQKIFENVSAQAWSMWADDMMIKIINEYRLNLAEKSDYDKLITQMCAFLNLPGEDGQSATAKVLEVENAARGKGDPI
ncbi:MAG: oxidative damage protection protein [Deltaproteobacteria bacterium]|nr:oxidative damage protection protein [Deltaproteobacteria bacterium]